MPGRLLPLLMVAAAWLTAAAAPPVNPRIVLQTNSEIEALVEVAAWTPDGKYLLTANGYGRIVLIWETATGHLIDRVSLPVDPGAWAGGMLRLDRMTISTDGRTATLQGIGVDVKASGAAEMRGYRVNLATRAVTVLAASKAPANVPGVEGYSARQTAMATAYSEEGAAARTAAERTLPLLPRSPDGQRSLVRTSEGLAIKTGSAAAKPLMRDLALGFDDAALSPDGRMLVLVESTVNDEGADGVSNTILRYDLSTGRFLTDLKFPSSYGAVHWLDAGRLMIMAGAFSQDRASVDPDDAEPLSATLIVDPQSGAVLNNMTALCFTAPVATGFIAADLGACRHGIKGGSTVMVGQDAKWRPLKIAGWKNGVIEDITVSPDGKLAALIVVGSGTDRKELWVIDTATGAQIDVLAAADPKGVNLITAARFTADGTALIVAANGGTVIWPFGTENNPRDIAAMTSVPQMMVSDGATVAMSGLLDSNIARARLADGAALPSIDFANAIAGGFMPGKPVFWAASGSSGLRLWDTRDWREIVSIYPIDGGKFVAVTPDGRYDTNLGPDAAQFRWIVPDAPFQSLGPQTFMRDYFSPRLTSKALDCTLAGNCATVLPPLPAVATLNRVLPEVRIAEVVEAKPGVATVTVEARETNDPAAANGRTHSGLFNVRLFRDGKYAGHEPHEDTETLHQTLDEWRQINRVDGADADGWRRWRVDVPLPSGPGATKPVFTAYAFNEDRVKGDTARRTFARAAPPPRPKRAFIVSIGIDDYDETRLKLRFGGADAKLIAERLAAIPGHDVRRAVLTTTPSRRLTWSEAETALLVLAGGWTDQNRAILKEFDAGQLDQATPDDLVIVTWSGHGYANPRGDFFLVPSDARWAGGAPPIENDLISADQLTLALRQIDAGEMAFVIDACHSAASVATAGFKPGPMGDPGLGQLAYDKGMRILAATQGDDVALEDARLGQGLLTYTLAAEGLTPTGGQADENKDGRITLDEWLRYAVARLPSLGADLKTGKLAMARGIRRPGAPPPKTQEPSLFDFTGQASPVVLRGIPK